MPVLNGFKSSKILTAGGTIVTLIFSSTGVGLEIDDGFGAGAYVELSIGEAERIGLALIDFAHQRQGVRCQS